jgi:hypothetical protein
MALLSGTPATVKGIDVRTTTFAGGAESCSYAHGLPAMPDFVMPVLKSGITSTSRPVHVQVTYNATNVTASNSGLGNAGVEFIAVVAYNPIR